LNLSVSLKLRGAGYNVVEEGDHVIWQVAEGGTFMTLLELGFVTIIFMNLRQEENDSSLISLRGGSWRTPFPPNH